MSTVVPTISGPKRPQDKVLLTDAAQNFKENFKKNTNKKDFLKAKVNNADFEIQDGSILIAAITSCTNTSIQMAYWAGLLAKKLVNLV